MFAYHRVPLVILCLACAPGVGSAEEERGRLVRVTPERSELILRDATSRSWTFHLTAATSIELQGSPARPTDLRPAYSAIVTYETRDGRNVVQKVTSVGVEGSLRQVRATEKAVVLVLGDETEWESVLSPTAVILLDRRTVDVAALSTPLRVRVLYDQVNGKNVVTRFEGFRPVATMAPADVKGVPKNGKKTAPKKDEPPPMPAPPPTIAPPEPPTKKGPIIAQRDGYAVVRVFFGTNRARREPPPPADMGGAVRLCLGFLGVAVLLACLVSWLRPHQWKVAWAGVLGISVALAFVLVGLRWQLFFGPSQPRPGEFYGSGRGELEYGTCEVSIPESHDPGQLEAPSFLKLQFREDPTRHVVLQKVEPLAAEAFFTSLQGSYGGERKTAFIFIHGYNVTFENAARRTAQIAFDLGFTGAPVFYSWPSQGELRPYAADEGAVEASIPYLQTFLADVARRSGAETVHVVAHSMGNRILGRALEGLARSSSGIPPVYRQVVLAAPDVDAQVFREQIVPALRGEPRRLTLYASSGDRALQASRQVHDYPRAGEAGDRLLLLDGLDTVDATGVDPSVLGHAYIGECEPLLQDLRVLLGKGLPPLARGLDMDSRNGRAFWRFRLR